MKSKKTGKTKSKHIKMLAKVTASSKKSKGNKKEVAVDPCQISCTDSCKPYCTDGCKSQHCETSGNCMTICKHSVKTT